MSYSLLVLESSISPHSGVFFEGAVLAANLSLKPMPIEQWLVNELGDQTALTPSIESQFHQQYAQIMANNYQVATLFNVADRKLFAQFAQGFFIVWAHIEDQWLALTLGDGSMRMLQALLTTMMLAVDEKKTQLEMMESGIVEPPQLSEMLGHLDVMIAEVAHTANDFQLGSKASKVNPYKTVGRNDVCPCGSGKKYKQCCL
jgi:uncharacterized protein